MPETHIEHWRKLTSEQRAMLARELRFLHVEGFGERSGGAECANSFVLLCNLAMITTIGDMDTEFVARHGLHVVEKEIVVREATHDESLLHVETLIAMDKEYLEEIPDSKELKFRMANLIKVLEGIKKDVVLEKQRKEIAARVDEARLARAMAAKAAAEAAGAATPAAAQESAQNSQ
jgi:hypothetical protein